MMNTLGKLFLKGLAVVIPIALTLAILLPRSALTPLDIPFETAMRLVLTGGVSTALILSLTGLQNWVAGWQRGDAEFVSTVKQAEAFKEAMADRLEKDSEAYAALELYSRLVAATRWQRLKALHQFGLWRSHWLLNIVLVMRMVLLPRESIQ